MVVKIMKFYNKKRLFIKSTRNALFLFLPITLYLSSCARNKLPIETTNKKTSSELSALLKNSSGPLVVKFFASWCPPCQRFGQIFETVAQKLAQEVTFISIDIEAYPTVTTEYAIKTIPTVIYLKNGKQLQRNSSISRFSIKEFEQEVRNQFSL